MHTKGFAIVWVVVLVLGALALGYVAFWQPGQVGDDNHATTTTDGGGTATTTGGGPDQGILPYNSGISGILMLGPTCPVMRDPPDPQCADKPFQTLVAIYRASDPVHAIVITKSSATGEFKVSLPPGNYIVGAGESNLPRCAPSDVTVLPNKYAAITISCDTGIR